VYRSPVGSPSQSMSVLGHHVGSRCAFLPAAHQRAQAGPPAHGGRPAVRQARLGSAAQRRQVAVGHAAGSLVGRVRRPQLACPYQDRGCPCWGRLPVANRQSATRARIRRGPWPWAAGPAPNLRRGRRGTGNPGPNRRRCHWQVAGPAPRVAPGAPGSPALTHCRHQGRVAPGAPGSPALTHCRHQGGHRHHAEATTRGKNRT
jgi:hypothetical protein